MSKVGWGGQGVGSRVHPGRARAQRAHAILRCMDVCIYNTGGAPQGGQGGRSPPQLEHWGGIAPPTLGYNTKGCMPKSPLLSLFCNSVYWLKPHNNVNSRPPNLAVLPPPL